MALISTADPSVPVTVQTRTAVDPVRAFAVIVPIDLPTIFRKWGPFPGVRSVANQPADWDRVGASRRPELTDGSHVDEMLTEYSEGYSFAYELTGFTSYIRRVIEGVRGEWTFTADGHGTVIRWTYEFKPLRGYRPVVRWAVAPLWRRYMTLGLAQAKAVLEASTAS